MIRTPEQMVREFRENMRGGSGKAEVLHVINQDDFTAKVRLCAKLTLFPGASIGLHEHNNEEELYYIIQGKGLIQENGVKREVNVGDAILTASGSTHSIENIGTDNLELMAIVLLH